MIADRLLIARDPRSSATPSAARLWRIGLEGGEPERVTTTPAEARHPVSLRGAR